MAGPHPPIAGLRALIDAKNGQTISVCLPARNEEATIGPIVSTIVTELVEAGLIDELLVIDDQSSDQTGSIAAAAGATVMRTDEHLVNHATGPGKGQAMWKSVHVAKGDILVWCDTDVRNFTAHFVTDLVDPLLTDPAVSFVKGFYERDLAGQPGEGGRVTELVARPLLSIFFPELGEIRQPLSGEYAGRRSLIERLPFVGGYGVETGLLIDVASAAGVDAIAQVDLGTRVHRNRPLSDLGEHAMIVAQTILRRAGIALGPDVPLLLPDGPDREVAFVELPPAVSVAGYGVASG